MQEITLEELYEVFVNNKLYVSWGHLPLKNDTEAKLRQILTDLNKLGYKIVKQ